MKRFALIVCVLLAVVTLLYPADKPVDGFIPRTYRSRAGNMPYRLFEPAGIEPQRRYPLVVWLHGAGGAGIDNLKQIEGDQVPGTHIWTRKENQARYPAFVVAPQSPGAWGPDEGELSREALLAVEIVEALKREFPIDPDRVYVAGQSNGGFGVWSLITERPDLFAAAIPLCGGGDPKRAAALVHMPIWAFHGDRDDVIPVSYSRDMIAAIRKAGGFPKYTEYKGVDHNVWTPAFREAGLVDWLFAQRR
ncbi:MAG TPA: prolyl oligopeptidase family serine peptidase [Terriglobia bacterium]|nr:prolyl oligopeptidase family serine peptidase [Terriglobia bacterium]